MLGVNTSWESRIDEWDCVILQIGYECFVRPRFSEQRTPTRVYYYIDHMIYLYAERSGMKNSTRVFSKTPETHIN